VTDAKVRLGAETQNRIALTIVLLGEASVSTEQAHKLLMLLCEMAYTEGVLAALKEMKR